MHLSAYEIILPLTNGEGKEIQDLSLLVNGLYGSVDVVAHQEVELLFSGDFDAVPKSLLARLISRGHLTEKTQDEERKDLQLLGRIYRLLISRIETAICILPTYDCNFRCPYCFERHRLKNGKEWLCGTISTEMIDAVFNAIQNERDKGHLVIHCTLYGGEPLLKENIQVVRYIGDKCRDMGLKMNAITNGYDLDEYIDLLDQYPFQQLQITVDGVSDINNALRVHRDGCGSYDKIMSNIELALEHGIDVHMRVNVGQNNIHGMKDLVEDLRNRGFVDKEEQRENSVNEGKSSERGKFSYYFKAVEYDEPENSVTEQEIMQELLDMGFSAEEAIARESQYFLPSDVFRSQISKKVLPPIMTAFCGSEMNSVIVDPYGKLFPCWDQVAKEDASIGFLDKESGRFIWDFEKARWLTRTSDLIQKCADCPYAFICRGGCASRAMAKNGSFFREYCGEIKEIFSFIAPRLAGEVYERTGDKELSLSWFEPLSLLSQEDRNIIMNTGSQKEILGILQKYGIPDMIKSCGNIESEC
ncbi:MAG: radical SAM protein [Saccharofermentans sp.]|nr:radical SAM protein [Saccharofermentans sp.]